MMMRILPREHGATGIWLASLVLAFASLSGPPPLVGLAAFIVISILALLVLGQITASSAELIRLERNRVILPLASGSLTMIVPLASLIMAGQLPVAILAAWLVFLTYTVGGVAYTQAAVRAVKRREPPSLAVFVLPISSALIIEAVVFEMAGWLHIASVAVVVPLFLHWLAIGKPQRSDEIPMGRIIRRVGFTQMANMIAVTMILAVVLRL